jgi:hypothetical protein
VQVRQRRVNGPLGLAQMTEVEEMFGQGPGLFQGPGLESRDELGLVDQPVLEREQPKEEMAVCRGSHDMASIIVGRAGAGPGL